MKNPMYVATMLLGVSAYCAGSENTATASTPDIPHTLSADACVASEGQGQISEIAHSMLPEETKHRLQVAYWFGKARDSFQNYCFWPYPWIPQSNVDTCNNLIASIHLGYRTLSPQAIADNDLVELSAPFRAALDVPSSDRATELYRQKYGLEKNPSLRMYLDKNGELKRYYYEPNKPINYIPTQKKSEGISC